MDYVQGRRHRGLTSAGLLSGIAALVATAMALHQPRAGRSEILPAKADARAQAATQLARLPLQFEQHGERFLAHGPGYALAIDPAGAALRLRGNDDRYHDISLSPRGAGSDGELVGEARSRGTANYFRGDDAARWHTQLPMYSKLRHLSVYPGIDLLYYGRDRQLEYDFEIAPGADPQRIVLDIDGAETATVNATGDLELGVAGGTLLQHRPFAYQTGRDGRIEPVASQYRVAPIDDGHGRRHELRFELGDYDRSRALVIDPLLSYSTYIGGVKADDLFAMVAVADGIIIAGTGGCQSNVGGPYSFPTTAGAFDTLCQANEDAYVAKLSNDGGELLFSSFIGGESDDQATALAVDAAGNVYVGGHTRADGTNSFPRTPGAYQTEAGYVGDGFLVKLDATGSQLLYGTLFGGKGSFDFVYGLAVDAAGDVYMTGQGDHRSDRPFPVTEGAYDTTPNGDYDAYVAKLRPAGVGAADLLWSTLLGGTETDQGNAVYVNDFGVYVVGSTTLDFSSAGRQPYPTTANAHRATHTGGTDAFFTVLSLDGKTLKYSTLIGSEGSDRGVAMAADTSGKAYVGGYSSRQRGFPATTGAYDTTQDPDSDDGFIAKYDPSKSGAASLLWATLLGGSGADSVEALAVSADDKLYAAGYTSNFGTRPFPTTPGAMSSAPNSSSGSGTDARDAFFAVLPAGGTRLLYSSFFGGAFEDRARTLVMDASGLPVFGGVTRSNNLLTSTYENPYQSRNAGGSDGFVTRFGLIADSTAQFTSTQYTVPRSATFAEISVERLGSTQGAFEVHYSTTAGTAHPGSDYRAVSGEVEWLDGEGSTKSFRIPIMTSSLAGDAASADEEAPYGKTILLKLSLANGQVGTPANAVLTILFDPPKPGTIAFDPDEISVDEGAGAVQLTLTRSGGDDGDVSVRVRSEDVTARAGQDYGAFDAVVTFVDGDHEPQTISVPITDDTLDEERESFRLNFSEATGEVEVGNSADLYINDNDEPPPAGQIEFDAATLSVDERVGLASVRVRRVNGSGGAVSASLRSVNGSALGGSDYLPVDQSLSFADGDTTPKTVMLTIINDSADEDDEQFELQLANAGGGATIGDQAAMQIGIVDDDAAPAVQLVEATSAAAENAGTVYVRLRLSTASGKTVTAPFTLSGSAARDVDYAIAGGNVVFAPGITEQRIAVALIDDSLVEELETIGLTLAAPANATLGTIRSHTLTISSEDVARPGSLQLAADSLRVNEADGSATITVTRRNGSEGAVSARVSSRDGSAIAGADYTALSATVNFADGDSEPKIVSLAITDDGVDEADEVLSVQLAEAAGGAAIGTPASMQVTIDDDAAAPYQPGVLQLAAGDFGVIENAGPGLVTIHRVGGSDGAASVRLSTADDSAQAPADYAATDVLVEWADGDAAPKTVAIAIVDDTLVEAPERVALLLSQPGGAAIGDIGSGHLSIVDDDQPAPTMPGVLRFAVDAISVNENAGTVSVTVQRVNGDDGAVSVVYATHNGSASAGADYTAAGGTLSWADGDTGARSITLAITDDTLVEGNEGYTLTLATPAGGALLGTPNRIAVSIVDNDSGELQGKSGGGAFGGGAAGLLALAALLRRRGGAWAATLITSAFAAMPMLANAAGGGWYAGLRGGPSSGPIDSHKLEARLRERGYAIDADVDRHDVAGTLYAGYWLKPDLALELGVYDLGDYRVRIDGGRGDIGALAAAAAHKLPGSGSGVSLGLRPLLRFSEHLALDVRGGLSYGQLRSEVRGAQLRVRREQESVGVNGGLGLLLSVGRLKIGVGAEAYVPGNGSAVYPAYGLVELHFGSPP